MAHKVVFLIFVLPAILSIIFGSAVLGQVLQEPDRELNMLAFELSGSAIVSGGDIKIIGIEAQYSTDEPVEVQVAVDDPDFDCGDLYLTIYETKTKQVFTQSGFFEQCIKESNPFLPVDDEFSEVVDTPGTYELKVEMVDKSQTESIDTKVKFIVK